MRVVAAGPRTYSFVVAAAELQCHPDRIVTEMGPDKTIGGHRCLALPPTQRLIDT